MTEYLYGCADCDDWTGSTTPDFGNCPFCGQPRTVWNQTDAESETDHELILEEQINEILHS